MAEKGEYGGSYSKSDASKDTSSSASQVSHAWHDARDDAAKEGGWGVSKDRHNKSSSNSGK